MSYVTQFDITGFLDPVLSLSDNAGTPTFPTAGDIAVVGGNLLTSTSGVSTLTFDLDNGTDGQLIIGGGADPAWADLTSLNSTISFTTGANTLDLSVGDSVAIQFDADAGSAVPAIGIITMAGGTNIATSGAGSTITIDFDGTLPVASGGTGATTLTDHGVVLGSGTAAVSVTAVGTDGQVLLGATAADPAFASLTSTGGTIVYTPGANSLNLETDESIATSYDADTGSAVPAGGVLTVDGGANIATSGSGSTLTIAFDGTLPVASGGTGATTLTDHGVLLGSGTAAITAAAVGTDGQVLLGASAADAAFATLTSADGSVVFATGANTLDLTVDVAAGGGVESLTADSGGAISPTAGGDIGIAGGTNITTAGAANTITVNLDAAITLATSVSSPLYTVATGDLILNMADDAGTDSVSFTNDSDVEVAYIDSLGASSFTELDVDNLNLDGNTIISTNTNGDITLTPDGAGLVNVDYLTQYHLPIIGASGSLNDLADGLGTATQVLTSNGAGAEPTWEDAGGGGGGITWNEETGTSATMAVNNGYIANNAGLVTLTLPTTAAVGDVVRVAGSGAGGWAVAQNTSEIIHFGSTDSTTGVGGSLASTVRYDAVELLCIVANTEWSVISSLGNITIV